MCLNGLIIVLFCRIHDKVVYVQSRYPGSPKKGTVKTLYPFRFVRRKIICARKTELINLKWSKRMYEEVYIFWCHIEVGILTRFGIFCRFRKLYTYTP